ncbi:MAG: AGE family epimerase/isomerase [Bryobacterales bacterium]|nr:AGE family epimerase/isomerase [Bryobacterales bacterium]
MNLADLARQYRSNLLESVIPFWTRHSVDWKHGGYFSCLDRDGAVYDPRKYVWLQGRQIWMYSRLYNQVERRQEWLDIAALGVEFLTRHARDSQGRYFFRLSREGTPSFFQRKPYSAVFAVMALAEFSRTGAGSQYRSAAIDLFWRVLEWIANPELLGRVPMPGQPPFQSLADSIVIAKMALEVSAIDDDPRYERLMRNCLEEALLHEERSRRILLENRGGGGDARLYPEGRLFNPGHSIEATWLLWLLAERLGEHTRIPRIAEILEGSLETGWDREFGGLYYFMDIEGRPTLQLEASMKLWWPHAEALYAVLLAYTRTGESRWLPWLERIHEYSFQHFADDPRRGEWFAYCDRQGDLTHTLKGNHYKGCFHVPRALLYCAQTIENHLTRRDASHREPPVG